MLVFLGQTKCFNCDEIINKDDGHVVILPIFENKKDELYTEEIILHRHCLEHDSNHQKRMEFMTQLQSKYTLNCFICGKLIQNPDEYYRHNVLSSNSDHVLFPYNFLEFHEACYFKSDLRYVILDKIKTMIDEKLWESSYSRKKY